MSAPLHQQSPAGVLAWMIQELVARPARHQAQCPRVTGGPTSASLGWRGCSDSNPRPRLLKVAAPASDISRGSGINGYGGYPLTVPHSCNPRSCTRDNSVDPPCSYLDRAQFISYPLHLVSEPIPTPFHCIGLAQFIETRSLRQGRAHLMAMDPSIQSFLERLEKPSRSTPQQSTPPTPRSTI